MQWATVPHTGNIWKPVCKGVLRYVGVTVSAMYGSALHSYTQ